MRLQKFQSTHPLRGATVTSTSARLDLTLFQSTHPLRGATLAFPCIRVIFGKFQSTRPLRGATAEARELPMGQVFQSTRPLRGATLLRLLPSVRSLKFQSTRPLRGATRMQAWPRTAEGDFNPRAPCGARLTGTCDWYWPVAISIHAPLAGRDATRATPCIMRWLFQSTHPLRGATARRPKMTMRPQKFQSTHPLRGATELVGVRLGRLLISIHAPLAGRDDVVLHGAWCQRNFNPRAPCGARLAEDLRDGVSGAISIHAPLAGCDGARMAAVWWRLYFNPRTPCGVRPVVRHRDRPPPMHFNPRTPCGVRLACGSAATVVVPFQSTHPLRGATLRRAVAARLTFISIHAPLAGCDCPWSLKRPRPLRFQSTHPLRGATAAGKRAGELRRDFNPRTPCGVRLHRPRRSCHHR